MDRQSLEFRTTRAFDKAFTRLPVRTGKRALEKLALYENAPRHPSLRVKKVEGTHGVWEMSVSKDYRITFQREGNIVLLRNIGTHDILKRSKQ